MKVQFIIEGEKAAPAPGFDLGIVDSGGNLHSFESHDVVSVTVLDQPEYKVGDIYRHKDLIAYLVYTEEGWRWLNLETGRTTEIDSTVVNPDLLSEYYEEVN